MSCLYLPKKWVLIYGDCHVELPCFHSNTEQTNHTLTLDRDIDVFASATVAPNIIQDEPNKTKLEKMIFNVKLPDWGFSLV